MLNIVQKSFTVKTVAEEDPDFYRFEGYASTYNNVDRDGDVIMPGAFSASLKEMSPKLMYQHDWRMPIGVIDDIEDRQEGLYIRAKMPKANTDCQNVYSLLKCGAIDSMSIGFTIDDSEYRQDARVLKKLKLYEVSVVTIPANEQAKIAGVKSKSSITVEDLEGLDTKRDFEKFLRDSAGFTKQAATTFVSKVSADRGDPESGENYSEVLAQLKNLNTIAEKGA